MGMQSPESRREAEAEPEREVGVLTAEADETEVTFVTSVQNSPSSHASGSGGTSSLPQPATDRGQRPPAPPGSLGHHTARVYPSALGDSNPAQ